MKKFTIIMLALLIISVPDLLPAQQLQTPDAHHPPEAAPRAPGVEDQARSGQDGMRGMMPMHEMMMKRMQEMDRSLDQKLAAMNAAVGEQNQIEAIKEVINEAASQRKEMMSHMMSMQGKMMSGEGKSSMMGMMGDSGMTKTMKRGEKSMIIIIQE
jgi:hypothetical protein